ncbi:hypothetical protein KY290_035215 [Solanum tuberosum]|uniref:Apple domain-containing protein n=1 Tax=Solanum tuberosum TaxID=4113 RepID=A0ABQ7U7A9_SOLTU|nr:hypothetical protein KY289_034739 [Solanum tuberosum]KAH0647682.1 hypothetical protein KY285_032930 [Solanum tuberosum]KAH0742172.1 hypothetical protein KY290_035215 [Solanum tuberosum]
MAALERALSKIGSGLEVPIYADSCTTQTEELCFRNCSRVAYAKLDITGTNERALGKIGSGLEVPIYADSCTTHTEELCFRNCSRVAYAKLDIAGTNEVCLFWFNELVDIREFGYSVQDIYIKLDSSETEISTGNSSQDILKKLRISLPLAALSLLSMLCLILYIRHTKKEENQNQQHFSEGSSEMLYINKSKNDDLDLPLFDFATILDATNNFFLSNKLGEGGFGPVYKGALKDGQEITVSRLSRYSAQGTDEFKNEIGGHCLIGLSASILLMEFKIAQKQQPKQWQHKKDQKPEHIEGQAANSKKLRSNGEPPNTDNMQNWQTVKNIPTSK